jgi:cobalt/nickel transport system ATP-binding protein
MVIASHDLVFVRGVCSRAIVLDRGKVVADGPTSRIFGDDPLLLAHGLA